MIHISILIPQGQFSVVNIGGSHQILQAANDFYFQESRKELFNIDLVSRGRPANDQIGLYSINPTKEMHEIEKTDLIIIPAVHGDIPSVVNQNQEEIQWIVNHHKKGAEIASFCVGVFLLAETGILDGKSCSTHWAEAHALQRAYPKVQVKPENIVTESDGILTSGGAYAFTNLLLYLIEKYGGRELAILISKTFMLHIEQQHQTPFIIFHVQKDHQDQLVLQVQTYIEQHFKDKFTVDELAREHATIRRTLERRFKRATGNTVNEYTQRVRTEAAKKLLEAGHANISEVLEQVGYGDPKAFRDVFRRYVGITPTQYRDKFKQRIK